MDEMKSSALELGDDGTVANGSLFTDANTLWTWLAAFLVVFMQAGVAMVEAGFARARNACKIIVKNLTDFSIGSLKFWLLAFGIMVGATGTGWFGTTNFLYDAGSDNFNWAFLIFQAVFCATAATICTILDCSNGRILQWNVAASRVSDHLIDAEPSAPGPGRPLVVSDDSDVQLSDNLLGQPVVATRVKAANR